jgi:vancomycin resistance protein YoaR
MKGELMRRYVSIWFMLVTILLINGCNSSQPKPFSARSQVGVTLEGVPVGNMTADEIREAVRQIAAAQKQDPVNAGFVTDTTEFTPEKNGVNVNVERTVLAVLAARANTAIKSVVEIKEPLITVAKLRAARLVGQAETPLLDKGENRIHNILIAAHDITNTTLTQGEIFSFNRTIGKTTVERGYRVATIIEDGQATLGMGGGVCQISSTLYGAVLAGNLAVVERHSHSKPVDYVSEGLDATTSDDKDFKFRNNRRGLLILHVLVTANTVKTAIWEIER